MEKDFNVVDAVEMFINEEDFVTIANESGLLVDLNLQ